MVWHLYHIFFSLSSKVWPEYCIYMYVVYIYILSVRLKLAVFDCDKITSALYFRLKMLKCLMSHQSLYRRQEKEFSRILGGGGEKLPHPFFVLSLLIISSSVFPYPGGGRGGFKNFCETKWGKKKEVKEK